MNRIPNEKKKSAHEEAIIEILEATKKLTANKTLATSIFQSAGIFIDDSLSLVSLAGNAEKCVTTLMYKLSPLQGVRLSARRILWNRGLRGGQSVSFLCSAPPQRRTSWLARRTGGK